MLMHTIIQIDSGPYAGRKIRLRKAVTTFGKGVAADLSIPGDPTLADVHFEIEMLDGTCRARNLDARHRTQVNGESVDETVLADDDKIMAGESTFSVCAQAPQESTGGDPDRAGSDELAEGSSGTGALLKNVDISLAEFCAALELGDEAVALIEDAPGVQELIDLLAEKPLYTDAIKVLAHYMTRRLAVWWACQCVDQACSSLLDEKQAKAYAMARDWVADPSDVNRRRAMHEAQETDMLGPGSWAAMSAFWSGDSLAPAELEVVPPPDHLTSIGVLNTLTFSAVLKNEKNLDESYAEFLTLGRDLAASDDVDWPS
jgi:hypothetical protein